MKNFYNILIIILIIILSVFIMYLISTKINNNYIYNEFVKINKNLEEINKSINNNTKAILYNPSEEDKNKEK